METELLFKSEERQPQRLYSVRQDYRLTREYQETSRPICSHRQVRLYRAPNSPQNSLQPPGKSIKKTKPR